MSSIIDFHTHPYLNAAQSLCMYPGSEPPTPEAMKQALKACGVERICGGVLRKDRAFDFRTLDDAALSLRDRLGADFYTPGFQIHPAHVAESVREIEAMHAAGLNLIGELVPYMHGWGDFKAEPYTRELNEILSAADPYHMVCSYHTMWDWPMEALFTAHPNLTFVAAHPGERESVLKHIERMKQFDNVYLDLSGTGIFRFGSIRTLVNAVGTERILFGTDYPICNPEMYIHAVLGEHLGSDAEEKIFYGNAKRILRLA